MDLGSKEAKGDSHRVLFCYIHFQPLAGVDFIRGHFPNSSEEAKVVLSREFMEEEFFKAIKSMGPLKALGPDEF